MAMKYNTNQISLEYLPIDSKGICPLCKKEKNVHFRISSEKLFLDENNTPIFRFVCRECLKLLTLDFIDSGNIDFSPLLKNP